MSACPHCGGSHAESVLFCPNTGKAILESLVPSGSVIEGKYRVVAPIASGGMGAIYEVEHVGFGKHFAMKLLLPELAQNMEVTQRFEREAKAASAIGHPNIIEITDVGETDSGLRFIVMELLRGQDLAGRLADQGRLPVDAATGVLSQVLLALGAAHSAGIIHRDLKPENVFLHQLPRGQETVKLLDFGISKIASSDEAKLHLTSTGLILGTPYYMAPEQAKGSRDVDQRADLYAVGVILYETLVGRRPYAAENLNSLIYQIMAGEFPPPRTVLPDLPEHLDAVVLKAMAMDPAARFQSAAAFREALLGQVSVVAPPPATASPAAFRPLSDSYLPTLPQTGSGLGDARLLDTGQVSRPRKRSWLWVGLAALLAALAAAGLLLWQGHSRSPSGEAPPSPRAAERGAHPDAGPQVRQRPVAPPAHLRRRPERVRITVRPTPADADIELDGHPLAKNPFFLPRNAEPHRLRVTAPGYRPRTLQVLPSESQVLVVTLPRALRRRPRRGARRPTRRHAGARHAPRRPSAPRSMRHRIETTTDI